VSLINRVQQFTGGNEPLSGTIPIFSDKPTGNHSKYIFTIPDIVSYRYFAKKVK